MHSRMHWRLASLAAIVVVLSAQSLAQPAAPKELSGTIHDYLVTNGERWHVSGEWSLQLKGDGGTGDFSAMFIGVPRDNPPLFPNSAAHTHFVSVANAQITATQDETGKRTLIVSGPGTFTGNGNLQASFSGSHVEVRITGGNTIPYSNFGMTISAPASEHYGNETFHGVVTRQR
jgi:hypothetical protein